MASKKTYGNLRQTAEALGVSRQAVQGYIERGQIPRGAMRRTRTGRYKIDIERVKAELPNQLSDINRGRRGKRPGETIGGVGVGAPQEEKQRTATKAGMGGMDLQTARRFNEQYKAALKKLEYEQKAGKLIEVERVQGVGFDAGRMIKERCLSIADRCSPLVAAESDQFRCKQILVKEISQILEGLSEALQVVGR